MSDAARTTPRGRPHVARRPVSVLVIDSRTAPLSPGLDVRAAGIELSSCSTGPAALLAIGEAPPDAVIVPTDVEGVDLLDFVYAVTAWSDAAVVVGMGADFDGPRIAYAALERGARGLVSLPLTSSALAMTTANLALGEVDTRRADVLESGAVRLDPGALRVTVAGVSAQLTVRHLRTLQYLMNAAPRFVSIEELAREVDPDYPVSVPSMKTAVSRLRRTLADASIPADIIEVSRGTGYRLNGSVGGAGNPSDSSSAVSLR